MNTRRRIRRMDEREELLNKQDIMRAANEIAMREDLENRFGGYKDDVSVGNMYQRKKKAKKSKAKRKTKGCGCK